MGTSNKFLEICKKCKAKCCKACGPTFDKEGVERILREGYGNYFVEVKKGFYELKTKRGVCPYLKKDNSCELQKIKPLPCLCWPVYARFNKGKKEYIIWDCPLTKHLSDRQIEKCKKEASKIPDEIIKVSWDMSTLPKSQRKLILKRLKQFKMKVLK